MNHSIPQYADVEEAFRRIEPFIHRTPILTSSYFNRITGAQIFFKCENFQKIGAFKFRGALNAIKNLPKEEGEKGIVTHSSGNHAQAVALASKMNGYQATIVMPENAPKVKAEGVREYGATVVFCEPTNKARAETAQAIIDETGATFIHPFNNPHVIAGQGTAAKEFLEEIPQLDIIMGPIGGGGLISGTAIAAKHLKPGIQVIGTEPELADDAYRSFKSGKMEPVLRTDTVADGLRTSIGELTFQCIQNYVDDIVTVPEESIVRDMKSVWERMKMIIEPSCAVPLSAVIDRKVDVSGKKIGIIITGGNVDLENLPW